MRAFLQRHHRAIWILLVLAAAGIVAFWVTGLRVGAIGTGVNWRHS